MGAESTPASSSIDDSVTQSNRFPLTANTLRSYLEKLVQLLLGLLHKLLIDGLERQLAEGRQLDFF